MTVEGEDLVDESLWMRTSAMEYMAEDGKADHPSHTVTTNLIRTHYPTTRCELLDCGVLSGVTYGLLKDADVDVRYTGIDISPSIVSHCREIHPDARWEPMSVQDLAFPDDSFDVVNARHLLECLPYYETAVRELFRVSRRHVVIGLFQPPRDPEVLVRRVTADGYIWLNRYAQGPFEALLNRLSESVETIGAVSGHRRDRVYVCVKR